MIDVDTEAWHPRDFSKCRGSFLLVGQGESSPLARQGLPPVAGLADGSQGGLGKDERSRGADGKRDPPLSPGALALERHDPTQPDIRDGRRSRRRGSHRD